MRTALLVSTLTIGTAIAAALPAQKPVRALPGFFDPGAIVRDGDTLYVANREFGAYSVSVVDVSVPFAETIVRTILTPIQPVDIAVTGGRLYVTDSFRNRLHHRSLAGGSWQSITLPAGSGISAFGVTGNQIFPDPDANRMFVLHPAADVLEVVDLDTGQIAGSIAEGLENNMWSMVFTDDGTRFVVLERGGTSPSCTSSGRAFSVFDRATLQSHYEVSLQGICPRSIAVRGEVLYMLVDDVVGFSGVMSWDLRTGSALDQVAVPDAGGFLIHNGRELIGQLDQAASAFVLDFELVGVESRHPVLAASRRTSPSIHEMVAMEPCDGRVFIANSDDDTLSIIDLSPGFIPYGEGCPGSGGITPELEGSGCLQRGSTATVTLSSGPGGAPAALLVGIEKIDQPLGACTLWVDPLVAAGVTLSGTGSAALVLSTPPAAPFGSLLTFQGAVLDAGAPGGFTLTGGVRAMVE